MGALAQGCSCAPLQGAQLLEENVQREDSGLTARRDAARRKTGGSARGRCRSLCSCVWSEEETEEGKAQGAMSVGGKEDSAEGTALQPRPRGGHSKESPDLSTSPSVRAPRPLEQNSPGRLEIGNSWILPSTCCQLQGRHLEKAPSREAEDQ